MRVAKTVKGYVIDARVKRLGVSPDLVRDLTYKWNLRPVSFDAGTGQGVERGVALVHPETGEVTVVQYHSRSLQPVPVLRVSYGYADCVLTLVEE